jgi:hypothetical protein
LIVPSGDFKTPMNHPLADQLLDNRADCQLGLGGNEDLPNGCKVGW